MGFLSKSLFSVFLAYHSQCPPPVTPFLTDLAGWLGWWIWQMKLFRVMLLTSFWPRLR